MVLRHSEVDRLGKLLAAIGLERYRNGHPRLRLHRSGRRTHAEHLSHLHLTGNLCLHVNAVKLDRLKLILHKNRHRLRQLLIQIFQQRFVGIKHVLALDLNNIFLAVYTGNMEAQLSCTATSSVNSLAHGVDNNGIHNRRHQLLVLH